MNSSSLPVVMKLPTYISSSTCQKETGLTQLLAFRQGSGDFWAQPAEIRPFTISTGFFRIWPVANLLPLIWTGQYPIFFFKCRLISLLHCNDNQPRTWALISKPVFQCSKIMKCKNEAKASHVRHSPNHSSLQWTDYLNSTTRWYPTLDESNQMKSAYFTIHLGMIAGWNLFFF